MVYSNRKKLSEPVVVDTREQRLKLLEAKAAEALKLIDKVLKRADELEESLSKQ